MALHIRLHDTRQTNDSALLSFLLLLPIILKHNLIRDVAVGPLQLKKKCISSIQIKNCL